MDRVASRKRWVICAVMLATVVLAVTPVVDRKAGAGYESLFQRALVTFALARTLNGVISAVQGTELALQPAGVGLTLTPGEILDPVNDLVERFSWIMLGATVSLGVQQVLLDLSAWWVLKISAAALAVLWLLTFLSDRPRDGPGQEMLFRLALFAVFLRFAVPLTLIVNEALYDLFLEQRYVESTEVITAAGSELEELGELKRDVPQNADGSLGGWLLDGIGQAMSNASEFFDFKDRVERMGRQAARMIEHLIQLSVVFVLQTGVLPLVFLWLFVQATRWSFRPLRSRP